MGVEWRKDVAINDMCIMFVCVCVCVCVLYTHNIYMYIYTYIHTDRHTYYKRQVFQPFSK